MVRTGRHCHGFLECEPGVWLVMVLANRRGQQRQDHAQEQHPHERQQRQWHRQRRREGGGELDGGCCSRPLCRKRTGRSTLDVRALSFVVLCSHYMVAVASVSGQASRRRLVNSNLWPGKFLAKQRSWYNSTTLSDRKTDPSVQSLLPQEARSRW